MNTIYNIPSTLDVYEIKAYGYPSDDVPPQFFSTISIRTKSNTHPLFSDGNAAIGKNYDFDNTGYFLDPNNTKQSSKPFGWASAVKFVDQNNAGYFVDPSHNGHSIRVAGLISGVKFEDENNRSYYHDPAGSGISLNALGEHRGKSFEEINNGTYYLAPSNPSISLNVADTIKSDIHSEKEKLEKGLDLVELKKTLIQKIEELTLYVIELEKEMRKARR